MDERNGKHLMIKRKRQIVENLTGSDKSFGKVARVNSTMLAKNTVFNLLGQVIVSLNAIAFIPLIIKGLGRDNYGLLALALVAFGSFSLLDLGLGRTTTKYVAEAMSRGEGQRLRAVVWTSFGMQILIGAAGSCVLTICVPYLVRRMNMPATLVSDAQSTFFLLAISIPFILGSSALRGALEGAQRFDLVNYVKVSLNISTYVIPLFGSQIHLSLPQIVFLMMLARVISLMAYFISCLRALPLSLRTAPLFDGVVVRSLFSYSGWVAISNLIIPFLVQIDRYLIASLISVEAVAYYSVPFEALNGLWIIPGAITSVIFPAFSELSNEAGKRIYELYGRSIKYILLSLGPMAAIIGVFSKDFLLLWQGPAFSANSASVLQILVLGLVINSLEWIPSTLLMGLGRPDVVAKIHIIQVPLYFCAVWFFVSKYGIWGAALAFTLRVSFEAVVIFFASFKIAPGISKVFWTQNILGISGGLIVFGTSLFITKALFITVAIPAVLATLLFTAFMAAVWLFGLDVTDKKLFTDLIDIAREARMSYN